VDMGVCYFNLSDVVEAERLFRKALTMDANQPVALFNLGIVSESHERMEDALQFYHRAMRANPPDEMRQPLTDALQRVMQKLGRAAPALPPGAPGAGTPGGGK